MAKRKLDDMILADEGISQEDISNKRQEVPLNENKHSLDSDEEDSEDEADQVDDNEIEGEEDGDMFKDGEVQITPFNMKEELQEGHFDNQGHYHWKKNDERDVKDHWLDNIDWVKIKETTDGSKKPNDDSDDDEDGPPEVFDPTETYKKMLTMMKPNETVLKALQRLGKSSKISSAQRWQNKKNGIVDPNAELVTELTSLANEVLTRLGDMDVYQQTYERIERQIASAQNKKPTSSTELDMYSDDFDVKEKATKQHDDTQSNDGDFKKPIGDSTTSTKAAGIMDNDVLWVFKWNQSDMNPEDVHGPYNTEQMLEWTRSGYFKSGVWVRKHDSDGDFSKSTRIDFELYL